MIEPPSKRIKAGLEFTETISECYDLKFKNPNTTDKEKERLKAGLLQLRQTLEQTTSSSDVPFGPTKTSSKINWGKCVELLLEDCPPSLGAIKVLTERLSPGGGLL